MVNQGRWMLRDEDSKSRNLYIPQKFDRVDLDHISAWFLLSRQWGPRYADRSH